MDDRLQSSLSPATPTLPEKTESKFAHSSLRRDTPLMGVVSLLFLMISLIAASLGLFIKQHSDQPVIDATATALIYSQNSDLSRYGLGSSTLLVYDPLSNNKAFWSSNDNLGTCDIASFSKALRVTTVPSGSPSTPASPGNQQFHVCEGDDSSFANNITSTSKAVIEVKVQFNTDLSIGGLLFDQQASDSSEKFFIFSVEPDKDSYNLCLVGNSKTICNTLPGGSGHFPNDDLNPQGEFDTIAVVIRDNVIHQLYLNAYPLLSQPDSIQLEQQLSTKATLISTLGVIANVIDKTDTSTQNDSVELLYRDLKVWAA